MGIGRILDLLFPPACAACDEVRPGRSGFCAVCALSLTPLHDTAADARTDGLRILAPDAYGAALADAIVRMKHADRPQTARILARRIIARWPSPPHHEAVLVPVPLHPGDLRIRGYNQAALLADSLARTWGLPVCGVLRRIRRSGGQGGRDRTGRKAAVAGAFAPRPGARRRVGGRPAILVDDVITTCATAQASVQALVAGGVRVTAVVAAARAL